MDSRVARRTFLAHLGTTAALAACAPSRHAPATVSSASTAVPRRRLGRTGVTVSMVGIGGYHLGLVREDAESTRIVHAALDRGIDFLDNCWDYHDGKSEERMGRALADGHRKRAFLMTKLDGRTRKAATDQLEQSLRRLRTDVIDLVQIHEVIRFEDARSVFAEDGTIHALVEAKRAGKLRFIGFTGHKDPAIHLAMLKAADDHGFAFDTVQMPLNPMDAHYQSFEKQVLPVLVSKDIGVLGMKCLGAGKILESRTVSAIECLHYAMNLPTSVVITGCESMRDIEQAADAARTFRPLDKARVAALLERTRDAARDGAFERFKTSTDHDGTTKHPEWLRSA